MKKIITALLSIAAISSLFASEKVIDNIIIEPGEAILYDTIRPITQIKSENDKYKLSIGGNINLKANYDFGGSIDYPDFVTSMIPVPGSYDTEQLFIMDATTSRIVVNGVAQSEYLGDVELCLNMDFRGGAVGSYTPRVRLAYITAKGFTVGRNFTTFADMGSLAPTIDFQGPNVCPFIYTTQVRYVKNLKCEWLTLGGSIEYVDYINDDWSEVNLDSNFDYLERYVPDLVGYMQFHLGTNESDHIRVTGLYKNIPLRNLATNESFDLNGWGAQLSGSFVVGSRVRLFYSGTCGEGITNYLQDLYGSGLDVTVNSVSATPTATMPLLYGCQASGLVQLSDRTMVSAGYSIVRVEGDAARFEATDYSQGEYIVANIFHNITPRVQVAAEYLWGSRMNANRAFNSANRINTMVQYTF